jgi:hypothetical protein
MKSKVRATKNPQCAGQGRLLIYWRVLRRGRGLNPRVATSGAGELSRSFARVGLRLARHYGLENFKDGAPGRLDIKLEHCSSIAKVDDAIRTIVDKPRRRTPAVPLSPRHDIDHTQRQCRRHNLS